LLNSLYSEYILNYTLTMSKLIEQVQSSELSRNPLKVFSAAEKTPVTVTRRDGEDLVLTSKSQAASRNEFFEFTAKIVVATCGEEGTLTERMVNQFPWMRALDKDDREKCAKNLIDAALISMTTHQTRHALIELNSWKDTAEAMAAGWFDEPLERLEIPLLVPRPS
jgi:hypothetical protein